jgi:alcohol dehydrogenase class IV
MPVKANWSYPTSIRFGAGRIAELPDALKGTGISKPLLVTDPGVRNMPMLAKVLVDLERAGRPAAVFSDVQANPVDRNVEAGVGAYRAGGHDGVIAFGGGSALDVR